MPAHGRSKNCVASLACFADIHVLDLCRPKEVDGRDEPGHDKLPGQPELI